MRVRVLKKRTLRGYRGSRERSSNRGSKRRPARRGCSSERCVCLLRCTERRKFEATKRFASVYATPCRAPLLSRFIASSCDNRCTFSQPVCIIVCEIAVAGFFPSDRRVFQYKYRHACIYIHIKTKKNNKIKKENLLQTV